MGFLFRAFSLRPHARSKLDENRFLLDKSALFKARADPPNTDAAGFRLIAVFALCRSKLRQVDRGIRFKSRPA